MGVDYCAKAVIGVSIDPSLLYTEEIVKAFEHDYPSTMKFDPQTGKQLWFTQKRSIPQYDAFQERLGEFSVFFGTDDIEAVVGLVAAIGSDHDFALLPNLEEQKAKLRALLEPLGLWNEANFGLHSFLYCSY